MIYPSTKSSHPTYPIFSLFSLIEMMAPCGPDPSLGPKTGQSQGISRTASKMEQNKASSYNLKNDINNEKNSNFNTNNNYNNYSSYLLLQNQCSKILGVVLSICSHNIRDCFLGSNYSVTGTGLKSNKISKINHTSRSRMDSFDIYERERGSNIDKYVTANNILESFYETNSNFFGNSNMRVTGKKTDNSVDFHTILGLFSPDLPRRKTNEDMDTDLRNSEIDFDIDNDMNREIFSESFFTEPLNDPCLSVAIKDICKLYTNLEEIFLISPVISIFKHGNSTNFDSINGVNSQNNSAIKKTKSQSLSPIPQGKKHLSPVPQARKSLSPAAGQVMLEVHYSFCHFYCFDYLF
jgi:hypothetical protein